MSIINDIFDLVFVINRENDIFKRKTINEKFLKTNIKFQFIKAIDGYKEPILSKYSSYKNKPSNWEGAHKYEIERGRKMIPSAGAYGYLESWLKVLITAKSKKYKKILVFDDDIIFDNNFEEKAKKFFDNISKNFKIAALGVSQHNWNNIVYDNYFYNPIVYTDGSFALGIDCSIFDELINSIRNYNISFDSGPIRSIYEKYKNECFIAYPNLVIADVSTSSISGSRNMKETSAKFKWQINNFDYVKYCNIKVSIIITVYNNENTIKTSLKSILSQTYKNIEVIIIDDNSNDSSLQQIYELVSNYDNIKVIELKQNMGCYFAKNLAILKSTGSLIAFQDADDVSSDNRIELQVNEIINRDVEFVGCNFIRLKSNFDENTNFNELINNSNNTDKPRFGLITLMFKREVFSKYGYYNDFYHHSMDQEFIERIYFKNNNKISDIHCHELLNKNKFNKFYKINELLYFSQQMTSNNLSVKFNQGHKKYVRTLYLKDLQNKTPLTYVFPFKLVHMISAKYGKLINNNAPELDYLKYFLNNSNDILEINPSTNTNNNILITNIDYLNNNLTYDHLITTDGFVKKNIPESVYVKLKYNYFQEIKRKENEQILIQKKKMEEEFKKKKHKFLKMKELAKHTIMVELENKKKNMELINNHNLKDENDNIQIQIDEINNQKNEIKLKIKKKKEEEQKKMPIFEKFIKNNKIQQIIVSESIYESRNDMKKLANINYDSNNVNTLFYGLYTLEDFKKIKNHLGKKWLLFGGNDCNFRNTNRLQLFYKCMSFKIEAYLSISEVVNKNLSSLKLNYLYFNQSTNELKHITFKNNKKNYSENKNQIFENVPIFILNLKKRKDRRNFMKFKLNDIGIFNYEIFEAIDANSSDLTSKLFENYNNTITSQDFVHTNLKYISKKSTFAILLSYKYLIKNILDKYDDNNHVIIFEDDILFNKNINQIEINFDQDVVYLGANQLKWENNVNSDYKLSNNEKCITYGAYGVAYKVSFLRAFYNSILVNELRKPYDYLLWKFIVSNNISNKVIYPNLIIPNLKDSDNMGERDIFKIAQSKKWDISLYKYIFLELEYYNFYKQINHCSFRMKTGEIDGLQFKDISKIIEGNDKSFVFIISSFNNAPYYKQNLDSILNQTYKMWRIIYVDDCSTDNNYELVDEYIKSNNLKDKFILIKNKQNMKQSYSRFIAYEYCDDDEVICFLDGDDWLYDNNVLHKINEEYQNDIKLTYGSYYKFENNQMTKFVESIRYSDNTIKLQSYRQMKGWVGIPLRTGYAYLYKSIPESYLKDENGNWMSSCTDVAEFLWAIEQADGKFKDIRYPTYVYNIDASKRFKNSMYNLSKDQLNYRIKTSNKIFNYH